MNKTPRSNLGSLVLATVAMLAGCGSDDADSETIRLWIEPEMVECEGGAGLQPCLVVARSEGGEPELLYDSIDGFEFEEGTSYVVDVAVTEVADPPADASSTRYTLVEVVESDG